jgi:hypothetical protein
MAGVGLGIADNGDILAVGAVIAVAAVVVRSMGVGVAGGVGVTDGVLVDGEINESACDTGDLSLLVDVHAVVNAIVIADTVKVEERSIAPEDNIESMPSSDLVVIADRP